ncbi:MAG: hypothetical protein PHZ07_02170 [Patescibacteria group bacterium]|nr:hypothetical protein [Patescibacteria group bacterium]MDD4694887.1 hypothetical protein [Patescibacteria group bacterium]
MDNQEKTKKKFYKKWWFWVIVVIVIMTITNSDDNKVKKVVEPIIQEKQEDLKFTFDVPSLIGKNIDEIKIILGEPYNDSEPTELQLETGIDEWSKTFRKNNFDLLVTYNPKTKTVIDFFIPTNDSSGATNNTDSLLIVGNLKKNSLDYKVENVKAIKDPNIFTGIIVTY